jgi:hypothetical protein
MDRSAGFKRIPSTRSAVAEDNPGFMERLIVGVATTVVVSGGLGLAGLALAGTAHADDGPHQWCPGQSMRPGVGPGSEIVWDMHVCHTWYRVGYAQGNVANIAGTPTTVWDGPNPPTPPAPQCNAPGRPPCGLFP